MRKLLSIALLSLIGLAFVAPLLSWAAPEETRLPVCCRRAGAHHCALKMAPSAHQETGAADEHAPRFTAVGERCPFSPATVAAAHGGPAVSHRDVLVCAAPAAHAAGIVQTECRRRIARDRARQRRGPPASSLLA